MFEKVTRNKAKLRMGLTGPSGAGKTLSSLYIAYGITNDWNKIALIDTEHERARFYANRSDLEVGEFLYAPMSAPYSPDKYINYIKQGAEAVGPDGVVIVDSFSHAWDNEGGVIDLKNAIAKQSNKTDFSAWDDAGKIQNKLINSILSVDCHTIVTMRSKTAYAMETNSKGKVVPVKVGLAPVQRDNAEYEFDIVLQLERNHFASATKDTTFLDDFNGVITPDLGAQLKDWLSNGKEPERCTDCGGLIKSTETRSIDQMVEGTIKTYGRKLCLHCITKIEKSKKENEVKNNAE
jgi:KaiC/GvpD/RAD55 family RecA-like ATPase